jgi:hypothetical protein
MKIVYRRTCRRYVPHVGGIYIMSASRKRTSRMTDNDGCTQDAAESALKKIFADPLTWACSLPLPLRRRVRWAVAVGDFSAFVGLLREAVKDELPGSRPAASAESVNNGLFIGSIGVFT